VRVNLYGCIASTKRFADAGKVLSGGRGVGSTDASSYAWQFCRDQ
jgi:hypothetical protein